ncbi:hypothetical protein KW791_01780, partial [Candidatus Parcubacteria bacterium]|nr:hypothetical protein [Candidatus Parcubacteria bacterium]
GNHRIAAFSIVLVGAILVTRLGVLVHDPNPAFMGMELHHFDYGILILLISAQLSLFGPKKFRDLYIFATAIGSGLILDEYWIIRHGAAHAATRAQEYNSTIFSVMLLCSAAILVPLFIGSIVKHRRNKKQ